MKYFFIPQAAFFLFMLGACNSNPPDKKSELEALKKQHAEISTRIRVLEAELVASGAPEVGKLFEVKVTDIKPSEFIHFQDVYGKVDADENVNVAPMIPGTVKKIYVKVGQSVSTGQLLAELENAASLSGLEEAKTGVAFANELFMKQQRLWDQKIGTEVQYLSAKNAKEQAERRLATLQETIEMSKVKSPISGTVDEVMLKLGQAAAPGVPGIRVVNMNGLKAKADIAESFVGKIKQGNEVRVKFPDLNKEISGKVAFASKVINPLSRTFFVEVDLPKAEAFHPNQLAVLRIVDYRKENSLVVPVNVVQHSESGSYLMVAENKNNSWIAQRRDVKVGLAYDSNCEILEGLQAGDRLITTGFQDLNPGDKIKF